MATHSSIPAWRIPWTEEPGGLQSTGSQRVGHDWVQVAFFCPPRRYELLKHSITETAPYSNNVRSRYTPGSLDTSHITRQHPVAATASHSIFSETAHGPQGLRSLLLQCVKASSCTPTVCSSQAFYGLPKDFSFFFFFWISKSTWRFSFNSSDGKASACNAGDPGSIPGLGRSPGEGNDNPLQHSCLENPHGQRSLVGYSPWGCKESDTTEQLHFQ